MTANYFDNFDRLVMRTFVRDVLSALTFCMRVSVVFRSLSAAQKFALALEVVRIEYEIDDDASNAFVVMCRSMSRAELTLEELAEHMRTRYDVRSFAIAAHALTHDASQN